MKRSAALLLTAAMVASLAACGSNATSDKTAEVSGSTSAKTSVEAKAPVTIKYPTYRVGTHYSAPFEKDQIEKFNEKFGNEIKVQVEEIPSDTAYNDKMKILAASGDLPDVIMGKNGINEILIKGNLATPFNEYMDKDPEWKSDIGDEALAANTRDGKIWSISDQKQVIGYFYNKDMFEKAGIKPAETWDEFMTNCDKLKAAGFAPLALMTGENAWTTNLLLSSMVGTSGEAGTKYMNTLHPTSFETPEVIDALKKMQIMLQKYTTKDAIGAVYANAANNFEQGKTAIIANGPWMIGDFSDKTKSPEGFDKKVGVAAYPGSGAFLSYEVGYMIGSETQEKKDAAAKFIKYKTGVEGQSIALELGNVLPVSDKVQPSEEFKQKYPVFVETIEVGNSAKVKYQYFDTIVLPNVTDSWKNLYPELAFNKITAEEMAKKLTEISAKNK
ncbi:extracellular solute-binding protein [Clostridium sp. BNL1100]|uniref:ABC transporter substrate-binding protein n=1 Tax=Clostridium sp. BNL1100 TaxID=755731 RepID=UPI00024A7C7E|nr:extracellular solute-binding protein [Clostridium sp. BNL1100]AEY65326.1 ABC-type sugar transport system, periplasmic component [Clostridium sp. BNL1100]